MQKKDGYLMGIDYGTATIGLALGKNGLVSPLHTIPGKHSLEAIGEIYKIALQNKVEKFIVGLPLNAQSKETKKSLEVRKFAKLLRTITKKPVVFQNEFGTTIDAEDEMIEFDVPQKKRRIKDHFAAALILKHHYSGA